MLQLPEKYPDKKLIETYIQKIVQDGGRLLFLVLNGSRMLGTETDDSDWDIRGVYVPNPKMIFCNDKNVSTYTHMKALDKNTNTDLMIYPLNKFLSNLSRTETIAVNMLFSQLNDNYVLYRDPVMSLFDPSKLIAFNHDSVEHLSFYQVAKNCLLYDILSEEELILIKEVYQDALYGFQNKIETSTILSKYTEIDKDGYFKICGKKFEKNAKLSKVVNCFELLIENFKKNKYDSKSYSHALINYTQALELLQTGKLSFPISCSLNALKIKLQRMDIQEAKKLISEQKYLLEKEINTLRKEPDHDYIKGIINILY